MPTLALIRHGQSNWNKENRFTGWVDVDLSERGVSEAQRAGELLREAGVRFDHAFTSVQKRAIRTLWFALEGLDLCWLPVEKDWRLNERHYGGLTGLNKAETMDKHGADQVHIWRRSYDIPPPPLPLSDPSNPANDPRYAHAPKSALPEGESLEMTLQRVLPYWKASIAPRVAKGENIIISAHGNSLRALVKHLFRMADDDITQVEIPTGNPLLIDLTADTAPIAARYLDADRAKDLPSPP